MPPIVISRGRGDRGPYCESAGFIVFVKPYSICIYILYLLYLFIYLSIPGASKSCFILSVCVCTTFLVRLDQNWPILAFWWKSVRFPIPHPWNHSNITFKKIIDAMIGMVLQFYQLRLTRCILHVLPILEFSPHFAHRRNLLENHKHTLSGIWVRLVIFESVWGILESVLIEKLGVFFSWLWCLVHQTQHLGGNNSLIVHLFCMVEVHFSI